MNNSFKTPVSLTFLTGLLLFVGGVVGGKAGMILAFVMAAVMSLFSTYPYMDDTSSRLEALSINSRNRKNNRERFI